MPNSLINSLIIGIYLMAIAFLGWISLEERPKNPFDDGEGDFSMGVVCILVFVWGVCLLASSGTLFVLSKD